MSASPPSSSVHPFRLFTFEVDGVPHTKAFDHPVDTGGRTRDAELNHQFHAWLESFRPGYFDAGRVSRIAFTDRFRKSPFETDSLRHPARPESADLMQCGGTEFLPPVQPFPSITVLREATDC